MAKPILFNTEMVRAILEGRKTVTRRLVKPQPNSTFDKHWECFTEENGEVVVLTKPYSPGDILYVREAFSPNYFDIEIANFYCDGNRTAYKADFDSEKFGDVVPEPKWKPSIHMPKAMARIFLRVTDVRVERLQEMTAADAYAEGLRYEGEGTQREVLHRFSSLWDSTVKKESIAQYGWNANPWVWVVGFEKVEGRTDVK